MEISVSYHILGPLDISLDGFLSQTFWGLASPMQIPGRGPCCRATTLRSSGKSRGLVRCRGGEGNGEITSLPLLPVLIWSFYPFLWKSESSSFKSFAEEIDPYVAEIWCVYGRRCIQDLPILPSYRNLWKLLIFKLCLKYLYPLLFKLLK